MNVVALAQQGLDRMEINPAFADRVHVVTALLKAKWTCRVFVPLQVLV